MYLKDAQTGSFVARYYQDKTPDYIVSISANGIFRYYNNYNGSSSQYSPQGLVKKDSTIRHHDNFEYCDQYGKKLKNQKENTMNNVNYIGGDYKIVKVKYLDSGSYYNFKADIDMEIKDDDMVVVEGSNGYGLAKVSAIIDNNVDNAEAVSKAKAWVVSVVDTSMQDQRKEATRQRAYIIQQLDEKKSQMESISVYELLAKSDPSARKLLTELKSIGK